MTNIDIDAKRQTVTPVAARAQQPAMPLIGFLSSVSPGEASIQSLAAFRQGLNEAEYVEGQNIAIEYRWAEGRYDQLPVLAADLVRQKVAIIFAVGSAGPALAAKAASSEIPVVFVMGADPVEVGLVASLNRPGGNVTGVTFFSVSLIAKRLELLREIVPSATIIAALVNPNNPSADFQINQLHAAARGLGLQLGVVKAESEREFDTAFSTLVKLGAGALLISADAFFTSRRDQLAALALQHAVPATGPRREWVEVGALMSYAASETDAQRQGGAYAARILKGAKPRELPVVQPTRFELAINLKTAKALGLTIPDKLLALADEVIE
jgi:putative ABC transport system substrate-binding protein